MKIVLVFLDVSYKVFPSFERTFKDDGVLRERTLAIFCTSVLLHFCTSVILYEGFLCEHTFVHLPLTSLKCTFLYVLRVEYG